MDVREEGIMIYMLKERKKGDDDAVMNFTYCPDEERYLYVYDVSGMYVHTIPWVGSKNDGYPIRNTTIKSGEAYYDDPSGLIFSAVKEDCQLELRVFTHDVLSRLIIYLDHVQLSYPSEIGPTLCCPPFADNDFDVDLRVYCSEGRVVGMDYETGEYLVEIEGARTSGNIPGGGPEWISVPDYVEAKFVVDTTPAWQWMRELNIPDMEMELRVQQIFADEVGERTKREEIIRLNLLLELLLGDVNEDGKVDILDLILVAYHYNSIVPDPDDPISQFDLNEDGIIDIYDLVIVSNNWTD